MRRILISLLILSFSTALFAQDDINLLDLIKDAPADTAVALQQSGQQANSTDDWDWSLHRHSLTVSYGAPSLINLGLSGFIWLMEMGNEKFDHFSGTVGIEYDYNVKRWLRVGARLTYQNFTNANHYPETHCFTTSGRLDFTYMNRRKVRLYSGLEVGLALYTDRYKDSSEDDKTLATINLALVPFGLQAGGDHVYFMGELSLGTFEFCRMGIGYRF